MRILSIDLETFSELDIKKVGGYKYAENCEILLFAYAFDDDAVRIVDFTAGEKIPSEVFNALTDPNILKTAYNAQFERTVLSKYFFEDWLDPSQWFCTMVQGFILGLPGGLDKLGKVLNLSEDKQKLATGKRLIQYFCKPCKPTKSNGGRTRNLPAHDMERWNLFKEYCIRDVESERAIRKKIEFAFPIERERKLWRLDQTINDRGVLIDRSLAYNAVLLDEYIKEEAIKQIQTLTGIENPKSNPQILAWMKEQGYELKSFDKNVRKELYEKENDEVIRSFIYLIDLLGKTSVKKYQAMLNAQCNDDRVRGMLQFYGASRTGRWAGRLIQLHNLPQNHLADIETDRKIIAGSNYEEVKFIYKNPSEILSQLIRTAFIASEGHRFIVADFSAIEARVIAWLANEKWRMGVFANGGDIYCESASQMFHVPVVKHGINGELRQKGKVAELACGYGGGVNALLAFGADKLGMSSDEMENTIKKWREASPNIVALWGEIEKHVKMALRNKNTIIPYKHGISFIYEKAILFITLPSGRKIAYIKPRIELEGEYNKETITYEGTIQSSGGWGRNYTWGGKLVENIVQATARDCLGEAMLKLENAGYKIVMHIHDEVILDMSINEGSLKEVCAIMGHPIDWAPGLLLKADGYETKFYKKD